MSVQRIAQLNDQLRATFLTGKVVLTRGVASLPDHLRIEIATRVQTFSRFDEDNDPHGEHDFGVVDIEGIEKVFWKIDYYDRSYEYGSEDPSDASKTARVLTIMLASEW